MQRAETRAIAWPAVLLCLLFCAGMVLAQGTAQKTYPARVFTEGGQQIVEEITPLPPPPPGWHAPLAKLPPKGTKGTNILSNVPAFDWVYGCAPTAAAMMMGYYDRSGYSNMYAGPTNSGVCPLNNSAWGTGECSLSATHQGKDGLATYGHVDDYWISYNATGPDPYVSAARTQHTAADCTGDFMGTSQWAFQNVDGSTRFFNYSNGAPLVDFDAFTSYSMRDGCWGLKRFIISRGYTVVTNFSQLIYPNPVPDFSGNTQGFTYDQFKAEIDAGRPVLVHAKDINTNAGHTMLAYGYNDSGNLIYVHDTWDYSDHSMTWGGGYSYPDGTLTQYGVTVIRLQPNVQPPTANADSYTTAEDTPLTVAAPGVLGNDTDPQSLALTAIKVTNPLHGAVTLNSDGSFTYTPTANYHGADSFTYKANNGSADSTAVQVSLTITSVPDPPVANGDSYPVIEDTPLDFPPPGVLFNDTDPDGDTMTPIKITNPAHGTLILNTDGSFTYTPVANYNGTDTFTYKASDGALLSNEARVTLTISAVNDAPVAVNDSFTTSQDSPLTVAAPGVLVNDTDVDGDPLTATVVTSPGHGSLTWNSNGSFTYSPAAGWVGNDSFTYRANDGKVNSNIAQAVIAVTAVNHAPVANNDAYTTAEDSPLTVAASGVLANDTDADGNTLTAVLVSGPNHGTFSLSANGGFTYTPTANWNGTDGFSYQAFDGALHSATATVTLTVQAANDPPTAAGDAYQIDEDTLLTVAAPGVLDNDTDPEGDILTAVPASSPTAGSLTLNADGSFTYQPAANWNGTDTFTYKASDGALESAAARVTITVLAVNDDPTANPDTTLAATATAKVIPVLANDTDIDGGVLTVTGVTQGSHGTVTWGADSVTYTSAAGFTGTDQFTYTISDGQGGSAVGQVTVTVYQPLTTVQLTATPLSPRVVNTPITLTAIPTGGHALEYQFRVGYVANSVWNWSIQRSYGTTATCTWTPTTARSYTLQVWAREIGYPYAYEKTGSLGYVVALPLSAVSLAASPLSPQLVNTPITLTAVPTGGANVEYLFRQGYVENGSWHWTVLRGYRTSLTCAWQPTIARSYTLQVWAREVGSTAAYQKMASRTYVIANPLSGVTLAATPASPQPANTPITLRAAATGGLKVQYLFRVGYSENGAWHWTQLRMYGLSPTCTWTPTVARRYTLVVLAREYGSTASYQYSASLSYLVTVP